MARGRERNRRLGKAKKVQRRETELKAKEPQKRSKKKGKVETGEIEGESR